MGERREHHRGRLRYQQRRRGACRHAEQKERAS